MKTIFRNRKRMLPETIMPDGRPLSAWENELIMLRNESIAVNSKLREFAILRESLGLIYDMQRDNRTLDTVIRIKSIDAVLANDFWENIRSYLHIEEEGILLKVN